MTISRKRPAIATTIAPELFAALNEYGKKLHRARLCDILDAVLWAAVEARILSLPKKQGQQKKSGS